MDEAGRPINSAFDAADTAMLVVDEHGTIVDANAEARALFGLSDEGILGGGVGALSARPLGLPLVAGMEHVLASPSGERPFEVAWVAARGNERLAVLRHVTRRAHADAGPPPDLDVPGHHLEALARFAGGVAHDFNNVLAAIRGFAEVVHDDLKEGDPLRDDVAQILDAAERATKLTQQLLVFGRRQPTEARPVDPNAVIAGLGALLRNVVGDRASLELRLAASISPVLVAPARLEQVVATLVHNACDAVADGGTIVVETSELVLDRNDGPLSAGTWVVLSVKDDGAGMDEATRARMFDPFFTTKSGPKTDGLGLAGLFGIVRSVGGHVRVATAPAAGTRVSVHLPATRRPGSPVAVASAEASLRGTETILVVEDDPIVRRLAAHVLRRFGYTPVEAESGAHAIELALRGDGPIDAVLSDVAMPDMSGPDVVARIRDTRGALPVVYMSGYAGDLLDDVAQTDAVRFVQKPFTPRALVAAIRAAIESRR